MEEDFFTHSENHPVNTKSVENLTSINITEEKRDIHTKKTQT